MNQTFPFKSSSTPSLSSTDIIIQQISKILKPLEESIRINKEIICQQPAAFGELIEHNHTIHEQQKVIYKNFTDQLTELIAIIKTLNEKILTVDINTRYNEILNQLDRIELKLYEEETGTS